MAWHHGSRYRCGITIIAKRFIVINFAQINEVNKISRLFFVNINYWYLIYNNTNLKCCDLRI